MTTYTSLFEDKLDLNLGATFDPYTVDESGRRINTFNVNDGGGLFRMTSANINLGFSYSSKNSKNDKSKGFDNSRSGGRSDDLFGRANDFADSYFDEEEEDENDNEDENETSFYQNKIPWDIRIAHSLTYSNNRKQRDISNNYLMMSANFELSKLSLIHI